MATKKWEATGSFKWAKVFASNPDAEYEKYSVSFYPDDAGMKVINKSGVQLKHRTDDEGKTYLNFSRPLTGKEEWQGGPPTVFRPNGSKWNEDEDGYIGNESTGVLFFDTYDSRNGIGSRMNALQVINHVVFEKSGGGLNVRDYTAGEATTPDVPDVPVTRDLGDDIPF